MSSNTWFCERQSRKAAGETGVRSQPGSLELSKRRTSLSGSRYGSGLRSTPLTTLNMAVFAPMPRARVNTATAVKPGFFSSWRKANFRSFMVRCQLSVAGGQWSGKAPNPKFQINPNPQIPNIESTARAGVWSLVIGASLVFGFWRLVFSFVSQSLHWIDVGRASCRQPASSTRDEDECSDGRAENHGINGGDAIEPVLDDPDERDCCGEAECRSHRRQLEALS